MPELDQQTILIIVAVVVVVLLVLIALAIRRRKERNRQRMALRERFGPEYDRTVSDTGSERQAVEDLSQREGRRQRLELRGIDDAERDRVGAHMAALQYRFVEEPAEALLETQRVVTEVLRGIGYPVVSDRAEGLRMLSVDHPLQTQAVRALLQGEYGDDLGDQRHLFLDVRMALHDIAGIRYDVDDAARAPTVVGPALTAEPEPTAGDGRQPPRDADAAGSAVWEPAGSGAAPRDFAADAEERAPSADPEEAAQRAEWASERPAETGSGSGATPVGREPAATDDPDALDAAAPPADAPGRPGQPTAPADTDQRHDANPT